MIASTAAEEEGEVVFSLTISPSPSSMKRKTSRVTAAAAVGAATQEVEVAQALTATFDPNALQPRPPYQNAPRKTILSFRKRTQQLQLLLQGSISIWGEETMVLLSLVGRAGIRTAAAAAVVICTAQINNTTACPHYHHHPWGEEKETGEEQEEGEREKVNFRIYRASLWTGLGFLLSFWCGG